MSGTSEGEQSRPSRPTMKDVAALAGVAIKTVSRVMNGEPTVAPELATRVQDAAAKLAYRPNLTASSLRRGDRRTATIGLLIEDVSNPFFGVTMRAIEDEVRRRGVQILIGSLDEDPERERELAISLIDRGVDGMIIVPASRDHSYLIPERKLGTALVFLDREPRQLAADAVVSDNRGSAIMAVDHLLARGHRRIAYLGDALAIETAAQRFDGYCEALRRAGIEVDQRIVRHGLRSVDLAQQAGRELIALAAPATGWFTSQNLVSIGAVKALRAARQEAEVAMVGFDDFPLADVLEPGVTVVAQDAPLMGRLAAQLLFARLDGDDSPPVTRTLGTRLIERGSGEIPPRSR